MFLIFCCILISLGVFLGILKYGNKTTTDVFIFNNQIFVSTIGREVMKLRKSLSSVFFSNQAYFISTLNKVLISVGDSKK